MIFIISFFSFVNAQPFLPNPVYHPITKIADAAPIHFENITFKNGIPRGRIRQILQSRDGYIWINVTGNGLCRYDGHNFRIYQANIESNSQTPSTVLFMYEDDKNILWLAANDGLYAYFPWLDKFRHFKNNLDNESNHFTHIFSDKKGLLWVSSATQGFFIFDRQKNKFVSKPAQKATNVLTKSKESLPKSVWSYTKDSTGRVWMIGWIEIFAIYSLVPETQEWKYYPLPTTSNIQKVENKLLLDNAIESIYAEPSGDVLWLGGWNFGIKKLNTKSLVYEHFFFDLPKEENDEANSIMQLRPRDDSTLWACSLKGLRVFHKKTCQLFAARHQVENEYSILAGNIFNIYQDKNGIWWIGGLQGISKIVPELQKFKRQNLLSDREWILAFYYDATLQSTFYGGYSKDDFIPKIYRLDKYGTLICKKYPNLGNKQSRLLLRTIRKAKDGRYWVASSKGLFWLNPTTLELKAVTYPIENQTYKIDSLDAWGVAETPDGDVWFATMHQGLAQFKAKTNSFVVHLPQKDSPHTVSASSPRFVYADSRGWLWIGGLYMQGMSIYKPKEKRFYRFKREEKNINSIPADVVLGFCEDSDGKVWIATRNGICYYDPKKPEHKANHRIPVFNEEVFYICTDKNNNLWMSSRNGIFNYKPSLKKWKKYDESEGIYIDFNWERMFQVTSGEIFYSPHYRFFPENISSNSTKPSTKICTFRVFDKELSLDSNIAYLKKIKLHYQQNFFAIEFAGIIFFNAAQNQYAYRLDGVDKNWIYTTSNRVANYTNVPSGTYVFRVKSANNDGVWGDEIQLIVEISSPFWEMLWFKFLIIVLLCSILYGIYRFRVTQVKKEANFRKLLAESEMKALRAQLNPHFIFNCLNAIQELQVTKQEKAASEYLGKFAQLLRLILENSGISKISLAKELELLMLYLEMELLRFRDRFSFQFIIDDHIPLDFVQIPSLLIQPYVENAIWHGLLHKSTKGHLIICIQLFSENMLWICIEDNGIGRQKAMELKSKSALQHKSLGIKITQDRVNALNQLYQSNAHIKISDIYDEKNNPNGTKVELWIPI